MILDKKLGENVLEKNRILERLMIVKLSIGNWVVNTNSTYAPQVGLGKDVKAENSSNFIVGTCDRSEKLAG